MPNYKMTSALGLATAAAAAAVAAAAAIASSDAFADDVTVDTQPFVSTMTRAQVRSEIKRSDLAAFDEWSLQNRPAQFKSSLTRQQVRAEYVANRDEVRALTAEDSGSSYFWKMPRTGTSVMGGPAR